MSEDGKKVYTNEPNKRICVCVCVYKTKCSQNGMKPKQKIKLSLHNGKRRMKDGNNKTEN